MRKTFLAIFIFLLFFLIFYHVDDEKVKLSTYFQYSYEQKAIFGENTLVDIPPDVEFYCSDKTYILVKQRPEYYKDEMYDYNENYSYKNGLNSYYYWIVIKKEKKVLGPLTEMEFNSSVENLKISNKLIRKILK